MSVGNVLSSEIVNVYFFPCMCLLSGLCQFVYVILTEFLPRLGFRHKTDNWVFKLGFEKELYGKKKKRKKREAGKKF